MPGGAWLGCAFFIGLPTQEKAQTVHQLNAWEGACDPGKHTGNLPHSHLLSASSET